MTQQNQMIFQTPKDYVAQDPCKLVDATKTIPIVEAAFSEVDSKIPEIQISPPTEVQPFTQNAKFLLLEDQILTPIRKNSIDDSLIRTQEPEPIELMKVTSRQTTIPEVDREQDAKSLNEIGSVFDSVLASVSDRRDSNHSMSEATSCSSQSNCADLADTVLAAIECQHPQARRSQALRPVTFVTSGSSLKVPKVT